jgi:hypothetical protein
MVAVQLAAPQISVGTGLMVEGEDTGATAGVMVGTSPQRHSGEEGEGTIGALRRSLMTGSLVGAHQSPLTT